MKMFWLLAGACLQTAAPQSSAKTPTPLDVGNPPPRYHLIVKDNRALARFEVTLVSRDSRIICLGRGGWPDESGHVDWGSQWVKLKSNRRSFPARDWNFGYCEGTDCTIRVQPRSKLTGFIGYAEFGDPQKIAVLRFRHLDFDPLVYVCRPQ